MPRKKMPTAKTLQKESDFLKNVAQKLSRHKEHLEKKQPQSDQIKSEIERYETLAKRLNDCAILILRSKNITLFSSDDYQETLQSLKNMKSIEGDINKNLEKRIERLHKRLCDEYTDKNHLIWSTTDPQYKNLVNNPIKFKPKAGGAKNTGQKTGIYTFENNGNKQTALIKQGADVGETIAEYVGAKLYNVTMPGYAAECVLFKDKTGKGRTEDVYVGSVYANAKTIQDAFQRAGYSARGLFRGMEASVRRMLGKKDSLIHKVLDIDAKETNHCLAKAAANALWHGDHDFHTGNFVYVDDGDSKRFVKIDHGFSFFNFDKNIVDIRSATAGKVAKVNLPGSSNKTIEFFPTNHYWDIYQADPGFYYSPYFINACEEVCAIPRSQIKTTIAAALKDVVETYGKKNTPKALADFASRMGMDPNMVKEFAKQTPEEIATQVQTFMVTRLVDRQQSLRKLADQCNDALKKQQLPISKEIQKAIDKAVKMSTTGARSRTYLTDNVQGKRPLPPIAAYLLILQKANDLGLLTVDANNHWTLKEPGVFYCPLPKQWMNKGVIPNKRSEGKIDTATFEKVMDAMDRRKVIKTQSERWKENYTSPPPTSKSLLSR